ncbi:tetratricopeptide repeat protein [Myxococcota bacterium]|nr:tetratricopeptide repeat protein [Myxococcota bacterium]
MNRDILEQQAMQQLQRGNTEKALDAYLQVLRLDPKDRRIRQKVAELYITLGRKPEAIRHLTDVARSLKGSGQERAAVSLYMQLLSLKPDDFDARAELAECLEVTGRRQEARKVWEEAFHLVDRREPRKAIDCARRVARLSPGEVPAQVRVAELLEASRQEAEAFQAWSQLGVEARRFGRADDQARFLERALKLRPDDQATLLSAAEARIVQGEPRLALVHLQQAYAKDPRDVGLLTLLGRALQALGQLDKARKVWLQAARRQVELGDREAQVDALRHALECGEDDPALRAELERANTEARRLKIRLTDRPWAQPVTEAEARVLVRAQVQHRYGFSDRALATLAAAPAEIRGGVAWQVHQGELLIAMGRLAEGVDLLRSVSPPGATAGIELSDRLEVLGVPPVQLPRDDTEEVIVDEDTHGPVSTIAGLEEATSEKYRAALSATSNPTRSVALATDPDEARGDELAGRGDVHGAIAAYRKALARNPSNTEVLIKIGEVMSAPGVGPAATIPLPLPSEEPQISLELDESAVVPGGFSGFGDLPEDEPHEPDPVAEARALVAVGEFEQALDLLRGNDDVEALVVSALASRGLGRVDQVQARLERAVQAGGEHHPAWIEALWELSGHYLLKRRLGNAERLLDDVARLDPSWRPVELRARRRGIELLRAR